MQVAKAGCACCKLEEVLGTASWLAALSASDLSMHSGGASFLKRSLVVVSWTGLFLRQGEKEPQCVVLQQCGAVSDRRE